MLERNGIDPLYLQVKKEILAQIEDGRIRIGDKLMSENKMMDYYNVSRMTVRSALSELVSEGVLRKEQGLGSFCVGLPQKERPLNVDILVNCDDRYFIPCVLKGINSIFEKENANLLLHDTKDSMDCILRILGEIYDHGTDGVILQLCHQEQNMEPLRQLLLRFRQKSIPVVMLCGEIVDSGCTCLNIDDYYGACVATQFLLDSGHKRILGLFAQSDYGVDGRSAGVQDTVEKRPGCSLSILKYSDSFEHEILDAIERDRITAIVCYNDVYAVRCMRVLQEAGYRIPDDISLIGYDDIDLSMTTIPRLTTLSHPKDHLSSDAARLLLLQMRGAMSNQASFVYRPELVIRESVRDLNKGKAK